MNKVSSNMYLVSIVEFRVIVYQIDDFYCTLIARFFLCLMLWDVAVEEQPYLFEEKKTEMSNEIFSEIWTNRKQQKQSVTIDGKEDVAEHMDQYVEYHVELI